MEMSRQASGSISKLSSYLRRRFAAMAANTFAGLPDDVVTLKKLLKDFPVVVESAHHVGEMPIFRAAAVWCEVRQRSRSC